MLDKIHAIYLLMMFDLKIVSSGLHFYHDKRNANKLNLLSSFTMVTVA